MARKKPALIRVMVDGTERTVRADETVQGPRLREKLPPDLEARADKLFDRIGKYRCENLNEWREGFLRDTQPDQEIRLWEIMADVADRLHVDPPKALKNLTHRGFYEVLQLVSGHVVDIPSQLPGVTDAQVAIIRRELSIEFVVRELFDDSDFKVNTDSDPRRALQEAQVIFGVDVTNGQKFVLFGRKEEVEQQCAASGCATVHAVNIPIDFEQPHQLERVLALIIAMRGRHDYPVP